MSRSSYCLFEFVRELELARHGLKMNPLSFTPCLDGRYILLGPDKELNHSEISKFSKRDADAYPRYESQLERFCKLMDPLLDSSPPESLKSISSLQDRFKNKVHNSAFWTRLLHQAASLGQKDMVFVEGGMGSVSMAIGNAAKEAGAHIVTSAEVSQLIIEDSGKVNGVSFSSSILSNATPYKTFMELVPKNVLPDDFTHATKYSDYSSGTTKIVPKLPEFHCLQVNLSWFRSSAHWYHSYWF
ncbi:hypothetical protein CRYUN_Cryun15aG0134700 [Craigia yunnanensis]